MAPKLSDLSIADLRATLRANEASIGPDATSTRIIRRELQRKLQEEENRKKTGKKPEVG
jgi:ApbE superfamily uncharacterized protein (UPF0280 family)